jgi:hypothetical protein
MYLCNPAYDTASSNVEFAPSVAAAFSAATTAMDIFGHGAYTIPIWTDTNQNAYLNNWQRVINSDGEGIPNFFTWLNAYSPNPAIAGTIRQGFDSSTRSLSPYIATTRHDLFILNSIYDSPLIENPANNGQVLDWMTRVNTNLANNQLGYPQCSPPPIAPVEPCFPASTVNNLRLILRDDIFFQDGRHLTGSDVKFSYATLAASGAFIGTGLSPMTCARSSTGTPLFNCADGITVAGKNIVDIHLDSSGPFTNLGIGTTLVLPGRYWSASCPATIWDNLVIQGTVPDTCMTLDPAKAGFTYDPIANHVFIGSGSWECADIHGGTGATGFGCSDSGTQNPPVFQTYTLTRYGKGQPPAASAAGQYFRSSGTLALYLWSGVIGDTSQDVITASILSSCNNPSTPVQPLGSVGGCGHWQQGIGQRNGGPAPVTVSQTSIIQRFLFLDWVSPFIWASPPCQILPFGGIICTGPTLLPDGMAPLNGPPPATGPTLFEGTNILNPASKAGCNTAYPAGGYDC